MSETAYRRATIASRVAALSVGALLLDMALSSWTSPPAWPFFYIWIGLVITTAAALVVAGVFVVKAIIAEP